MLSTFFIFHWRKKLDIFALNDIVDRVRTIIVIEKCNYLLQKRLGINRRHDVLVGIGGAGGCDLAGKGRAAVTLRLCDNWACSVDLWTRRSWLLSLETKGGWVQPLFNDRYGTVAKSHYNIFTQYNSSYIDSLLQAIRNKLFIININPKEMVINKNRV